MFPSFFPWDYTTHSYKGNQAEGGQQLTCGGSSPNFSSFDVTCVVFSPKKTSKNRQQIKKLISLSTKKLERLRDSYRKCCGMHLKKEQDWKSITYWLWKSFNANKKSTQAERKPSQEKEVCSTCHDHYQEKIVLQLSRGGTVGPTFFVQCHFKLKKAFE